MHYLINPRIGVLLAFIMLTCLHGKSQDSIFQKMYYDDGSESHIHSKVILPRPDGGIFSLYEGVAFPSYGTSTWYAYKPDGRLANRGVFNQWNAMSPWPPFLSGYELFHTHVVETDTNKFVFTGSYCSPNATFPPLLHTPYIELQTWTGPTTSTSVVRTLSSPGNVSYVHKTPDNHLLFCLVLPSATFIVKTDLALNTVWIKKLGLPPYRWQIKTNTAGDIYLLHESTVVKLNSSGSLIWIRNLPGMMYADAFVYNDGGLIIAGGDSVTPPVLARIDSSGAVLWARGWALTIDRPHVAPCTGDPGFFLQHGDSGFVSRVDANGNFIWNRFYDTPGITTPGTWTGPKHPHGIQPAPNKGFWVQWGFVNEAPYHVSGYFLFKADSTGYSGCDTTLHPFATTPLSITPAAASFAITDTTFSFITLTDLTGNMTGAPPMMDACGYTCTAPSATVTTPPCGSSTVTANVGTPVPSYYQWKVNAGFPITNVPTINPALPAGWNTIRLTYQTGICLDTLYFMRYVAVFTPPSLGPDVTICPGDSITLTPGAGYATYTWAGSSVATPTRTVSAPGTYICTVTDSIGCTGSDTVVVSVYPGLPASLPTADTICAGSSLALNAGSWSTVNWSTGATTSSITVTAAGAYSVTVTNATGCVFTRTTTVTSLPVTPVGLPDSLIVCHTDVLIAATPGYPSYTWSTGATTSTIMAFTPGLYSVTATDANGCTSSDTTELVSTLLPAVNLADTIPFCGVAGGMMSAPPWYTTYLWSTGDTTSDIVPAGTGTYSVTVTDALGCISSDSTEFYDYGIPSVSLPDSLILCTADSVLLSASAGFVDYDWSTGGFTAEITVTLAGIYSVTVLDAVGCSSSDTCVVSLTTTPPVSLPPTLTFPSGGSGILDAGAGYATYLWSMGATTSSITVTSAGTYTVTVTDAAGCESTASCTVTTLAPPPMAAFSWSGGFPTLSFTSLSSDYDALLWDFGDGGTSTASSPSHTYLTDGTYTVCLIASSTVGADTACETILLTDALQGSNGSGIVISPNPFGDMFQIAAPAALSGSRWALFSAEGRELKTGLLSGSITKVSMSSAAAGVYWLRIQAPGGNLNFRIIHMEDASR